jgi:hypothetical protein
MLRGSWYESRHGLKLRFLAGLASRARLGLASKNGAPADMKVGTGQSRGQLIKWLDQFAA